MAARYWPYAVFLAIVGVYSWFTLPDGFNATDEGYLLALGQRVVDGEVPYRDFYFLRTPLSVYIQAALIGLLGESYTVLASRIYWLVQMTLATVFLSFIYRRFVSTGELVALLLSTFAISTLLLPFPWYNYDAVFFAIVTALCIHNRKFLPAGIAAFLAAMCKQNYLALLPGYLILAGIVQWRVRSVTLVSRKDLIRMATGFLAPAVLYAGYLGIQGLLGAFYNNVFAWPPKASQTEIGFVLFQDHPEALVRALPMIAVVTIWFYLNRLPLIWKIIGRFAAAGTAFWILYSHHNFVYATVYFGITVAVLVAIHSVRGRTGLKNGVLQALLPMLIFGLILQYLAGFNYTGVILAYAGTGLLFAVGWVLLRRTSTIAHRKWLALELLVLVLVVGWFHRYTYVYRDADRSDLKSEFRTEKLAGIESSRRNTWQIDQIVSITRELTEPGDPIFVFPDFPVFYYLTDRVNPTPIAWYIQLEYGGPMTERALESLRKQGPKLIFVQTFFEIDYVREGAVIDYMSIPRYAPIFDFITRYYEKDREIGDIALYLPRRR